MKTSTDSLPSNERLTVLDEVRQFIAEGQKGSALMIQMLREIEQHGREIQRLTRELHNATLAAKQNKELATGYCEDAKRLRAALFTAQDAMLECQQNAHKGHVCFDGDSWHERLKQVQDALVGSPSETRCAHCGGTGFDGDEPCEFCAASGRASETKAEPDKFPWPLYDGWAVLQEVRKMQSGAQRTSAENVSDVLDAIARLIRHTETSGE